MTKKFDDLNETFNVSGELVSSEVESAEDKIEKISESSLNFLSDYDNFTL